MTSWNESNTGSREAELKKHGPRALEAERIQITGSEKNSPLDLNAPGSVWRG